MNRPIVFYAFAIFIGCLSTVLVINNIFLGAAITASFLAVIFFTLPKRYSFITVLYFLVGILSFLLYFKINVVKDTALIRVIEKNQNYCVAGYNSRKIYLNGDLSRIDEGMKVYIKGTFTKKPIYEKGIVGSFNVVEYKPAKADFIYKMFNVKKTIYDKFKKKLGEEKAALVMSICYGEVRYLTQDQKNDFQKLGVIHAVSVSGFHLALIYKILEKILGLEAAIAVSLLYVVFTGGQAATVRSFIMIFVLKISKKLYRNYDNLSSICISAMVLLLVKPYYALDLGFNLSYLACIGIILYYKRILRTLYRLPKTLNESLSMTFSAQIFSTPFAAFYFRNISLGFILGNLFLAPLYSLLVILGNLSLLLLKIDPLFNIINTLIYYSSVAINGVTYFLTKISPPILSIDYIMTLSLLSLYVCYVFVKHGFVKLKYFPILLIFIVFIKGYCFFPAIKFVNIGGSESVLVMYKYSSLLIGNEKNIINTKNFIDADKYINFKGKRVFLRLGKNYNVQLIKNDGEGKKAENVSVEIAGYNKRTIITRDTNQFEDINLYKYDIIKLPKKRFYYGANLKPDITTYEVVRDKIYNMTDYAD